jgi:hypothetical protein
MTEKYYCANLSEAMRFVEVFKAMHTYSSHSLRDVGRHPHKQFSEFLFSLRALMLQKKYATVDGCPTMKAGPNEFPEFIKVTEADAES